MRKNKLDQSEKNLEKNIEQYVPVRKTEYKAIAKAIAARRKDAVLNIRVNQHDLDGIKRKAKKLGIKYQTFITEVLHKVAEESPKYKEKG